MTGPQWGFRYSGVWSEETPVRGTAEGGHPGLWLSLDHAVERILTGYPSSLIPDGLTRDDFARYVRGELEAGRVVDGFRMLKGVER